MREAPLILAMLKTFGEGNLKIMRDRRVVDAADHDIPGYDLIE